MARVCPDAPGAADQETQGRQFDCQLRAPAFPVQQAAFDIIFSYRGIGRLDLWDGAPTLRRLLRPGGRVTVLYPHFWYPMAPLDPLERRLWHYCVRTSAAWETYTWEALQERWRAAGFSVEALFNADFPPVHAASYVLELTGFNDSRWTVSQRLGLTSASMVPAALLKCATVARAKSAGPTLLGYTLRIGPGKSCPRPAAGCLHSSPVEAIEMPWRILKSAGKGVIM